MMDSGSNSGSIQSSSGGEEEHDSRADGISAAFLNNPPVLVGPIAKPNPPATQHPHSSSSPFDPFSNFFDPLPTRPHQNSPLNLHTSWPRNPIQSQSFMTTTTPITQLQVPNQAPSTNYTATNTNSNSTSNVSVRNPRKRTRASRRAPTTVLTTDTSNFRAMVQEFTGIPAPPFTPASSFPRARLDLFGAGSSTSTPPYLLRPFPQKLSPFLSPSSDFLLPKQNHPLPPNPAMPSIFNLQPNINLHVSLDSAQTTPEPNRNPQHLHQTPLLEELLSGNVRDGGWGSGASGAASDQALFRSMNAKYSTGTKLNNNYSASSSSNLDFHGDKGSENATNRSEGMIESWICSSD